MGFKHLQHGNINHMKNRIGQLYEQGADLFRIGQYVKKWVQWVKAGGMSKYLSYFTILTHTRGDNPVFYPSMYSNAYGSPRSLSRIAH